MINGASILAGAVLAGIVEYGLGMLTLNMRRIYLALATWAFAESYRLFISSDYTCTHGGNTANLFAVCEIHTLTAFDFLSHAAERIGV